MSYLLDTNVLSEMRRDHRMDSRVKAWADSVQLSDQYLSVITLMEIEIGTRALARRDPAQAGLLRSWVNSRVRPSFDGRILPVDEAVAIRCATLHVPDPRPDLDALIAATALIHGLSVVTRNVTDFQPMGVTVINPWQA